MREGGRDEGKEITDRAQLFTPKILTMQEAEIKRIVVQGQPRQNVHKTPS
jgi:hypothetical protein